MNRRQSIGLVLAALAATAGAQDLTHPTQMGLPESQFERPDPADYTLELDNGLVAYIARANQVPLVTMSAFVKAGQVSDGQQGAAEALAEALRLGPSGRESEFSSAIRAMTGKYTVTLHDEWLEISLNVPSEDRSAALDWFAATIRNPAIGDAAIERAAKKASPSGSDLGGESGPALYEGSLAAAVDRFDEILFADHPYGVRPTTADFADLSDTDVATFHRQYFVPGNMLLAIAGDVDPGIAGGEIEEMFGDVPFGTAPAVRIAPAIGDLEQRQHTFPSNKLQSWLVFGHELPQVPLEDAAALEVMNYILAGGHLYTRMTVETRYKYGYTNDASGFLEERWFGPGTYTFRSYSRHDVIKAIYDNMVGEIDRIHDELVTDEDLFIAKGALTDGNFQVRYLDGYAIVRAFALERLRFGDHSRSASYIERIRAVTAEDVREAARKYIRPERMQVVLVGEPIELLD
jgi:zinc protease